MIHFIIVALTFIAFLYSSTSTCAFFPFDHPEGKKTYVMGSMEKKENKNFFQKFKEKVPYLYKGMAKIVAGQITAIEGSTLKVLKDSTTYSVNTDLNTKFQRHFWGKSSLSEFSVGNKVNVYGKFINDSKTMILATHIRDLSIMKRNGVFQGEIVTKNPDNFVIKTNNRENQTIYVTSGTKFLNKKEDVISYNDVQINHLVKVKGVWDKSLSKVTDVSLVKDFSIPPSPTKSP